MGSHLKEAADAPPSRVQCGPPSQEGYEETREAEGEQPAWTWSWHTLRMLDMRDEGLLILPQGWSLQSQQGPAFLPVPAVSPSMSHCILLRTRLSIPVRPGAGQHVPALRAVGAQRDSTWLWKKYTFIGKRSAEVPGSVVPNDPSNAAGWE